MTDRDDVAESWLAQKLARWFELREQGREPSLEELCVGDFDGAARPDLHEKLRQAIARAKRHEEFFNQTPFLEDPRSDLSDRSAITQPPPDELAQRPVARDRRPPPLPGAANRDLRPADAIPEKIGRFRVEKLLGKGGFGRVYLARDELLDRRVAVKVPHVARLAPETESCLEEARKVARLDGHPGIVPVYDVSRLGDDVPFIAFEYVEGHNLRERIASSRPSLRESVEITAAVADALHFAHKQRLIHRDVKPENILLDAAGRPRVADFGAALRDEDFGKGLSSAASLAYMSPEQAQGQADVVDGRSDIFSLGVVLYELLTGVQPFRGESGCKVMQQIVHVDVRPPRQIDDAIPKSLELVCLKALAKRPTERYNTALDLAEALRAALPPPEDQAIFDLPFELTDCFTGREDVLAVLRRRLERGGSAVLSQRLAISGLGGIGKTQTALAYAVRFRNSYRTVLGVSAASEESLRGGYTRIAERLRLPAQVDDDPLRAIRAVLNWFDEHDGWLLLLDNADEPEIVKAYLPRGPRGHVLLTSRAQNFDALHIAEPIRLENLPKGEAAELLLKRAGMPVEEESALEAAQAIVQELAFFPLAIEQAGAYLKAKRVPLADYLAAYRQRPLRVLEKGRPSDYPLSVAKTWSQNFEAVEARSPAATDVLRLSAFLQPDAIPVSLLAKTQEQWRTQGSSSPTTREDPLAVYDLLGELTEFSLIQIAADGEHYSIHRLVQQVLKDSLEPSAQRAWAERTVLALEEAFPEVEFKNWLACERLMPHVHAATDLIREHAIVTQAAARLLHVAGAYLYERSLFAESERLLTLALELGGKLHAAGVSWDVETAATNNVLGNVCRERGKLQEARRRLLQARKSRKQNPGRQSPDYAETLHDGALLAYAEEKFDKANRYYQRALRIQQHTLAPTSAAIARTLTNLGWLLQQARCDLSQAEACYTQAYQIRRETLPRLHPDTADSLNYLAVLCQAQGRYAEMEQFLKQALDIWEGLERSKTPVHYLSISTVYHNLGNCCQFLARHKESEQYFLKSLELAERLIASDDPILAVTRECLGRLYLSQSKFPAAAAELQRALAIRERQGAETLEVAASLNSFGSLYKAQCKYDEAAACYQRALAIRRKQLPKDHWDVATSLDELGALRHTQGRLDEAQACYDEALAIREKKLVEDHPDIAVSLENVAALLRDRGAPAEAEPLFLRVLSMRERRFPGGHPDTAQTLKALSDLYYLLGDSQRGADHLRRSQEIFERAYPEGHLALDANLRSLAEQQHRQGNYVEAGEHYEAALAGQMEKLGEEHPDVATTMNNLGLLYGARREYARMEELVLRGMEIRRQTLGEDDLAVAVSLYTLAMLRGAQGNFHEAEKHYLAALAIREDRLGDRHPHVAEVCHNLGQLRHVQGALDGALPFYQRALAIRRESLGGEHLETANTSYHLAVLLAAQANYSSAQMLFEEALGARRAHLGADHLDVASAWQGLGEVHHSQQRPAEALGCYQEALRIRLQSGLPPTLDLARTEYFLADVLRRLDRLPEAEQHCRRALESAEAVDGASSRHLLNPLDTLAEICRLQGRVEEAEPIYLKVLAIHEASSTPPDAARARAIFNLAEFYRVQSRYTHAEELHRRALDLRRSLLGAGDHELALSLNALGLCCFALEHFAEAEALLAEALAVWQDAGHLASEATCRHNRSLVYAAQGMFDESEQELQCILDLRSRYAGIDCRNLVAALNSLALRCLAERKLVQAERLYRRALEVEESLPEDNQSAVVAAKLNLGAVCLEQQNFAEADAHYREALAVQEKILDGDALEIAACCMKLGEINRRRPDGDLNVANSCYERTRKTYESKLPPGDARLALVYNHLSLLKEEQKEYAEAERLAEQAVAAFERAYGPVHRDVAVCLENHARLSEILGNRLLAAELRRRAEDVCKQLSAAS